MKQNTTALPQPRLRVSQRVFVAVMDAVIEDSFYLAVGDAYALVTYVRSYMLDRKEHDKPMLGPSAMKIYNRYRDMIDRAAVRSARAREAARKRREARESAAAQPDAGTSSAERPKAELIVSEPVTGNPPRLPSEHIKAPPLC